MNIDGEETSVNWTIGHRKQNCKKAWICKTFDRKAKAKEEASHQ